ncbi:MAG: hydroxyacid dehydrogenase [Geminocystis sp.]|nr:hydroxyacid dehydrogenase [Geminocystis sp.]HIK37682.1 hydroxyacid dehydrogenase [Geminocystis sp. M7585_C2015_104]MCS7148820.1 hydroxyacid dehydrogenase [Geminocystis sp.]MCX8078454.1 hydroxyacid dehydrogenase [Geminocystis sp.]MDW8115342.1 hydroxyacid dehydrogenase [Geminocystis sp.]
MKLHFFEVEDWEKLYFEKKIRELNIDASLGFSLQPLDETNVHLYKDAEAAIVFIYSKLNKEVLDNLPNLKLIITRSTGYDHIDVSLAKEKGITVCNVPGYGDNTVAEYTFALILALARKIRPMIERTSRGIFSRDGLTGIDLMNKIIGVIGSGRIGRHVIRIAHGFGMNILVYDQVKNEEVVSRYNAQYVQLEDLLRNSDIVTLHVPYNQSTHHLINTSNIRLMKSDAMLINTSRGPVVQIEAIVQSLREGRLTGGIGLDTFEAEDIWIEEEYLKRDDIPAVKLKKAMEAFYILQSENVLVSPHNAYNTKDALYRILDITLHNLKGFLEGNPQNTL